jgi:hypothetical protein
MARVAWWLGTFVVLWWLWLLLAGEWNATEWIAAAGAAGLGATLFEASRARSGIEPRVPLRLLTRAASVPVMVVVDFGIVMWALVSGIGRRELPRGSFRAFGSELVGTAGIRAFATVAATFSPNAYVVDIDGDTGLALVHDLVPNRASEKPV